MEVALMSRVGGLEKVESKLDKMSSRLVDFR